MGDLPNVTTEGAGMNERKNNSTIKNWPQDDRPREKLLKKGATALSSWLVVRRGLED